jgi:LPS-assembly lipoprotein
MSLSSPKRHPLMPRLAALLGAAMVASIVAACSFSPVYSTRTNSGSLTLDFPEPTDRLQQIVYQELAFRLGSSESPDAPDISVSISASAAEVGRTAGGVQKPYQMTATANVTVSDPTQDGKVLSSFTRSASASYETTEQALGNQAAVREARERAAKAVTEMIRLKLLADLGQ